MMLALIVFKCSVQQELNVFPVRAVLAMVRMGYILYGQIRIYLFYIIWKFILIILHVLSFETFNPVSDIILNLICEKSS